MKYRGSDGTEHKLRGSTVQRLRHIQTHGSVGRLQAPGVWKTNEIRALEDRGLVRVDWVEPGDRDRIGGWVIQGLTPKALELLGEWERVVERGEGARGPRRGQDAAGV